MEKFETIIEIEGLLYNENGFLVDTYKAIRYLNKIIKYLEEVKRRNGIINELNKTKEETREKKSITKIYLMVDTSNQYTKIGRSKNPQIREKTLQSEKPTIELFKVYDGYTSDEIYLHRYFSDKHIRGEWFKLDKDDFIYIDDYFNNKD